MAPTPDDLSIAFRDWLLQSGLTWNSPKGDWTAGIKQFFDTLGRAEGFTVVYTRRGVREYLLDLAWIQETPKRFIQLGLESEMSVMNARCMRAFDKLTDTKAFLKVGIFRVNPTLENQLLLEFKKRLYNHMLTLQREEYLVVFLSYDTATNRIRINCYLMEPPGRQNGLLDEHHPFPI